jgi:hypothetical protein
MRALLALSLVAVAGCSGGPSQDDGSKAKLAADLVACQNEQSNLKDQIAQLKAQTAKAQAAADAATRTKLEPIDVRAQPQGGGIKHMEGNVSPEQVAKVVRQNSGGLRACYEKALKRKPDLQYVSTMTARFSIKNSGAAESVSFAPHADPEMEKCMAGMMEKWKFPTFQGDPVAFEQPVNLVAK